MDNPNAFKNKINEALVRKLALAISNQDPSFNSPKFLRLLKELTKLELKSRVQLVTTHLKINLEHDYPQALSLLLTVAEENDLQGFELWPFSEFIAQYGVDHFDLSMKAMKQLTPRFTSEFAVRPFILKNHKRVLKYFDKWAKDKNVHVRRWVCEGSRPLLPWGQSLPLFIMDPTHTLLLLDKLKFDEELYVRKSVANHLNDISKNHPLVVIDVLRLWERDVQEEHAEKMSWIKRHALRTLIKKGHPVALKLLGAGGRAQVQMESLACQKEYHRLDDQLSFSFKIESTAKKSQKLIIDYVIDFVKANGKRGKKVYKLKTLELAPGEALTIKKNHSLKPITTMKYYSGSHHLMIQINGEIMGQISFVLEV